MYILFFSAVIFAGEKDTINLIEYSLDSGKYYNAITESMRFEYLYPESAAMQKVHLLSGLAYFHGGNFGTGLEKTRLSMKYENEDLQAEAMHNIIYMRLLQGSVYLAQNDIKNYMSNFNNIKPGLDEKIYFEQISAFAFQDNFNAALKQAEVYRNLYPSGKYAEDLINLEKLITEEKNRPVKKLSTAMLGSAFIPGFSHFYTGDYRTGMFSLLSNALLIGLLTNAVMNQNYFEIIIFSFMELSFYQNSLYSSYNNVEKYNSRENFKKELKLGMEMRF